MWIASDFIACLPWTEVCLRGRFPLAVGFGVGSGNVSAGRARATTAWRDRSAVARFLFGDQPSRMCSEVFAATHSSSAYPRRDLTERGVPAGAAAPWQKALARMIQNFRLSQNI